MRGSNHPDITRLMTVVEIAQILQVSVRTVRRLIADRMESMLLHQEPCHRKEGRKAKSK